MTPGRDPALPHGTSGDGLSVRRIGADGDGLALHEGTWRVLPFTLPGESVRDGRVLQPSPDRVVPACPHFGACGGCVLQHWADAPYAEWKRDTLRRALAAAGCIDPVIGPLHRTPPAARRRITLALRRERGAVQMGLHRRDTREILDMRACPILHPTLLGLVAPLRVLATGLSALRRHGGATLNLLDTGPDLLLRTDGVPDTGDRAVLAGFAKAHRIARIAWAPHRASNRPGPDDQPEIAAQLRPVSLAFAGVPVRPPPGAFLQASREGEAAIVEAVLAGLPPRLPARAHVVELYAGCGTLTLPLSARARVTAYEGDPGAHAALRAACGGRRVLAVRRDLARQPVMASELAGACAAVLDPPYEGAPAQVAELARARVGRIVYVSCNPAALARDAAALLGAGYRLVDATPIDQFLWSARLEAVLVFELRKRP